MPQSGDEIFDVVDADDRVIGQARRADVHAQGLLHRAVHIFVVNAAGELLLQMRSKHKDQYPSTYTSSASGHLDAGENYENAAHRELSEELGLTGSLRLLHKTAASEKTSFEHTVLYAFEFRDDHEIVTHPTEIAFVQFRSGEWIQNRLRDFPQEFSPAFTELFRWWIQSSDCVH